MTIFDVKWSTTTAGPSPFNNERTELFLLGCHKAASGNACKGCFNPDTWHIPQDAINHNPVEAAYNLIKHAPNKYLTIGGGEPTDAIEDLIIMCRILKTHHFHILCYTWRDALKALKGEYGQWFQTQFILLIKTIDGMIDGEFILEDRCYNTAFNDGLFNSIGSKNQHLIIKNTDNHLHAFKISDIEHLTYEACQLKVKGVYADYGTF